MGRPVKEHRGTAASRRINRETVDGYNFYPKALVTLLLYPIFILPGFAANVVFRNEAREVKRRSGKSPAGLWLLDIMFLAGLLVLAAILFGIFAAGATWIKAEMGRSRPAASNTPAAVQNATPSPADSSSQQYYGGQSNAGFGQPQNYSAPRATPQPGYTPRGGGGSSQGAGFGGSSTVTSIAQLRPGARYQLRQNRVLSTSSGATMLPAGTWIHVEKVETASTGTVYTVEARDQRGNTIARGFMLLN